MRRSIAMLVAAAVVVLVAGVGAGAELHVNPGDSIQAAINGAAEGDTIYVHAGAYAESLDVGKRLTLIGDGADVVTVSANYYSMDHVFDVTADYVNISGFTVTGTTWDSAGFYLSEIGHCNITENNASNNYIGIYLDRSNNNTFAGNIANSNDYIGIYLDRSNNNTFAGNIANSNDWDGICLNYSSNNTFVRNTISNNWNGVYLNHSNNNTFASNTANSNFFAGFDLNSSNDNTFVSNTANSNDYGFHPSFSNDNTFTSNTANSNNERGIFLFFSNDNVIVGNTANSNNDRGIFLWYSSDNTLYHNNLHSNTEHNADDTGTNQWDSGTEGNYWGDYESKYPSAEEIGDTGIWNAPYAVGLGAAKDNYPLVEQWSGDTEIAYDDGSAEGSWSMGYNPTKCTPESDGGKNGYALRMTTPNSEPFTISAIKVFSMRYGDDCKTRFEIWDCDKNTLYLDIVPHSEYSVLGPSDGDARDYATWGFKDVPDVVVSGDFYVVMCTDSTDPGDDVYPDTGVEVCYDKSYSSDRAYVMWDNVHEWGEKTLTWDLSTPQETTNWMIRVVGTGSGGSADTTPPELEITSHESGDTVYTSTITVAGTASDASGIAEVTVDGVLASGAADWSTWSAEVTLAEGENPIIVVATDGAGLTTTKTVTVTYSPIVVNAEIVDMCIMGDGTFDRTETVTAAVTVKNTGNVEHEFYIGLSVYDPNDQYLVGGTYDAEPVSVTLEPDDTSIEYLTWTVPIDAFGGSWDVTVAVWDRVEDGKLCEEYDRVTEDDAFLVNDPVDKYAILVGINDYPGEDNDLDCSCNAASAMSNLLNIRYGFPGAHIQMLTACTTGTEVLKSDIEEAFRVVVEEEHIDSNDLFVFYFAGHGNRSESGKEWIALSRGDMYDGKLGNLVDATLRPPYVNPTAIIILDSCHSGGMAYGTDPEPERAGVNGDKTIMLMSTSAEEDSYETEDFGLSCFTYFLYNAFTSDEDMADRDGDGRVSLEEAFTYAQVDTTARNSDQNPQIMDHYLTSADNSAQCYLDVVDPTSITAEASCPIYLHAYDSEGRHTGMNSAGDDVEQEITGSCYSGPEFDPETIVVLGRSDNITYRIEALNEGEFNFTVTQTTDTKTTTIHYENVSINETTNATLVVNSSNPSYTMEIDYDGDGTIDNTTEPTHILINYAPNVSIITPAGVQSGDVTISYNLTDAESDNCTIMAQYSLDNITYLDASGGGDGVINLTSTPTGVNHTFVWASGTDMPNTNATVYFRIKPYDGGMAGDYATTDAFSVNNLNHEVIVHRSGGSGGGTYPPGWLETPTPTVTATPAETSAPEPTEKQAITPTEVPALDTAVASSSPASAPTETPTTKLATKGIPGFGSVYMITGMLAVAYLMLRRRWR